MGTKSEILSVKGLTKKISGENKLSNISFEIKSGQILALITTEEDSGKDTLFDLIIGNTLPTSGAVYIAGVKVEINDKKHTKKIGVVRPDLGFYQRLTTRQYLNCFCKLYGVNNSRIDEVIEMTGLLDRQHQRLKEFNHSFKARVQLARAIIHQPDLLLLDQPTVMVDLDTREILRRLILSLSETGTAVLITTTSREEAKTLADRIGELKIGKIANWEDNPKNNQDIVSQEHMNKEHKKLKIERIPAQLEEKIILFDPQELTYIESYNGKSLLHSGSEEFPCPRTLTELEERLKPFGFFRSHRSYIVNMQHVREVMPWTRNSYSLILDDPNQTTVPLSKNKYKDLEGIIGI
ncbi:MAG: LytTR family transcriptional regulator DNA-binding domain-containing protein [Halothermotrichaceae bacterium]